MRFSLFSLSPIHLPLWVFDKTIEFAYTHKFNKKQKKRKCPNSLANKRKIQKVKSGQQKVEQKKRKNMTKVKSQKRCCEGSEPRWTK